MEAKILFPVTDSPKKKKQKKVVYSVETRLWRDAVCLKKDDGRTRPCRQLAVTITDTRGGRGCARAAGPTKLLWDSKGVPDERKQKPRGSIRRTKGKEAKS